MRQTRVFGTVCSTRRVTSSTSEPSNGSSFGWPKAWGWRPQPSCGAQASCAGSVTHPSGGGCPSPQRTGGYGIASVVRSNYGRRAAASAAGLGPPNPTSMLYGHALDALTATQMAECRDAQQSAQNVPGRLPEAALANLLGCGARLLNSMPARRSSAFSVRHEVLYSKNINLLFVCLKTPLSLRISPLEASSAQFQRSREQAQLSRGAGKMDQVAGNRQERRHLQ